MNSVEETEELTTVGKLTTIACGILLIGSLCIFAIASKPNTSEVNLFQPVLNPAILSAIGLETGHYIGKSWGDNTSKVRIYLGTGFFRDYHLFLSVFLCNHLVGNFGG